MAVAKVTVYAPNSAEGEKHTIPNARDLVTHSGWTYKPGRKYAPTDAAPFASRAKASDLPKKAQEVLDSVGSNGSATKVEDDPVVKIAEDDRVELTYEDDEVTPPVVDDEDSDESGEETPPSEEAEPAEEAATKKRKSTKAAD